jgi:predicted SprT family Zn-dependent metalloprotease
MSRKIHCMACGKYQGEIRDAKLARGIKYICAHCSARTRDDDSFDFASELNKYKYTW